MVQLRMRSIIAEAISDPVFADRWNDVSDGSFRPFAAAVIELSNARQLADEVRRTLYKDLCFRKRVTVLAELTGKTVQTRVLKLLSRTDWTKFSRSDWNEFFSIVVGDSNSALVLSHLTQITPTLIRDFFLIPAELRQPSFLNVVSSLDVPAERWAKWRCFIHQADFVRRIEFSRAAGVVNSKGEFWDLYFRCGAKYWMPFSFPVSLLESQLLEPIASPQEMVSESIRMRNCLGTRISQVVRGDRIFFRLRNGIPVNAELVKSKQAWIPGDILGIKNSLMPIEMTRTIEVELRRLAKLTLAVDSIPELMNEDEYIENLRHEVRSSFAAEYIPMIVTPLKTIQAKSKSWSDGAFAIFEVKRRGYVQFMSSPDGKEYLLEISSHKYLGSLNDLLSVDSVTLIENAGFVWPAGKKNFMRWFNISAQNDIYAMAEITLAILVLIFKLRKGERFMSHIHIPT